MNIPGVIKAHIYEHYENANWQVIELDARQQITGISASTIRMFPDHGQIVGSPIAEVLPLVATENLKQNFLIPFYNHPSGVYDVHHIIHDEGSYLVFVTQDQAHSQLQSKQQLAHDENLAKLRYRYLFETLESSHEALKQANAAKSFYISALSHEMGNPLNAILGYGDLIRTGAMDSQNASEIIIKNVHKLQSIIEQTLNYDRQDSQRHKQEFVVRDLIQSICQDFQIAAQAKKLNLTNDVDPDWKIRSNQTQWEQIFTNLISNAIKYTDQGGITIQTTTTDGFVHVDVIDTGCGIKPEFQQKLFQAWQREYRSDAAGNGIGLVISQMLAEQINAELTLHRSNDSGSTFRFSIAQKKKLKILLVDDDEDCLNLFQFYLQQAGHTVSTANSYTACEQTLEEQTFDAIITDLNLGSQQAHPLLPAMKSQACQVILMTANPRVELRHELQQMGYDRVLSKPLSQQELVTCFS